MKVLIHGEDIQNSRNEIISARTVHSSSEIRTIDGTRGTIEDIVQAVESRSLSGIPVLVILENTIASASKHKTRLEKLLSVFQNIPEDTGVIIWENVLLSQSLIKQLAPRFTVHEYSYPKALFHFLDSLTPGRPQRPLELLEQTRLVTADEVIFVMLARRIRELLMAALNVLPPGLASWQKGRLTSQAGLYTIDKLYSMHTSLLIVDYTVKTGQSALPLGSHIEQFILDI